MNNFNIYKFNELPMYQYKENKICNKICNIKSPLFILRFGTEKKQKDIPVSIKKYTDNYKSENEYYIFVRLIKCFSESTLLKVYAFKKLMSFKSIYKARGAIYKYILRRYEKNEIKPLTMTSLINNLALMCLYSDPFNKDVRFKSNQLFTYSSNTQMVLHKIKYDNNILSEEDLKHYVDYKTLCTVRDNLKIENNKLTAINNNAEFNTHLAYLKLCINTYIPPLRLEFKDMIYIESNLLPTTNIRSKINYLYYNTESELYSIIINHDKVSKLDRYNIPSQVIFNLDINNEYMNSTELSKVLKNSFTIYPRKFIFGGYNNIEKSMNRSTYNNLLYGLFENKQVSQNRIRQAYHTHYEVDYKPRLSNTKLKDIANRMRHTLEVARRIYIKIVPDEIIEEVKENIIEEKKNIIVIIEKPKIRDRSEYMKKYFDKNSYGYIRQKNNRFMNYLKNGRILKAKQKTLDVHGIECIDGVYKFTTAKLLERKNGCVPDI